MNASQAGAATVTRGDWAFMAADIDQASPGSIAVGTPNAQATITIRRTSLDDVQQRQIIVKLDGKNIGELFFGDAISVPVSAGRHLLRVDNTWNWKTLELDLKGGDHLKFQTTSRAGRLTWFLVSWFGAGPIYVSIRPEH